MGTHDFVELEKRPCQTNPTHGDTYSHAHTTMHLSHFRERIQHTLVFMGQILGNTVSDSRKYYEQPEYKVLQTYDGFELREYEAQTWTSCNVPNSGSPKTNGSVGFRKLFQYITGKGNEENQSVSMTVPVLMQNYENDTMKMSFFLPKANSESPPTPTDPSVFTDPMQSKSEFYVRSFSPPSGDYSHYETNIEELQKAMLANGLTLKTNFHWIRAGYDAPFKIMNRHSEVWIPKDQVTENSS